MCVRTLTGSEINDVLPMRPPGGGKRRIHNLISVQEKRTKLHDESKKTQRVEKEKNSFTNVADYLLSKSTIKYGKILDTLTYYQQVLQRSKIFQIICQTTQPAHVLVIAAVLCVSLVMLPPSKNVKSIGRPYSRFTSFVYLASFVVHFGAQIWMTFISGLSLYFALPRHMFGEVQRVLFPRYFTINACLGLITLLTFVKHHPAHTWDIEVAIQVGAMSASFFLELLIRLYLTPSLLELIVKKNSLERKAGIGNETGRINFEPLKHCPHYMRIHHAFRRVHVLIAMGNMLSMACTVLHLQYVANKLCVT